MVYYLKLKKVNLSHGNFFKINFVNKYLPREIYELDHELKIRIKDNTKDIIEKNKVEDFNNEKTYRRKIKKKLVEN